MKYKRISRQEKESQEKEKKPVQKDYENIRTVNPYSIMLKPGESSRGRVSWGVVEEYPEGLREAAALKERLSRKVPK